ncbi:MAG: hypothetical protein KGM42_10890 [Hyphomicrobiales bacterium]|nr:hypothetical protein [Hyphomicrobiales bacterium]
MRALTDIASHTPLWVWPLFAWIVWQGVQALRERTQTLRRALIVPAIFFVLGLRRLLVWQDHPLPPLVWLVAASAFAALAWTHGPRILSVDRTRGAIVRPGSATPLLRNVGVFVLQYAVAATSAMRLDPNAFGMLASYAVSGATAGYFAGWALALVRLYRRAPSAVLQTN